MQDKATNKFNPKIWFNFDKGLNSLSSSMYTNHIHYGKKKIMVFRFIYMSFYELSVSLN